MTFPPARYALAALLALLAGASPAGGAGNPEGRAASPEGRIEKLDVTSVTRTRVAAWLKTRLPAVAKGSRQSFAGTVSVGSVPIPAASPVTVMVQPSGDAFDAVFLLELDLARITQDVVSGLGGESLAVSLGGTLTGEGGSRVAVKAQGSLRVGTPDIHASSGEVAAFVRFGGAKLSGLSLKETKGEATLVVFNPLGAPLGIEEIRYALTVDGRTVAEGVRTKVRLHAGRENQLALPIVAKNSELLAAAGDAAVHGGAVNGRLTGKVTVKTGTSHRVIPVDLPGSVSLIR